MRSQHHRHEVKLRELETQALALRRAGRYYLFTGLGLTLTGIGMLAGFFADQVPLAICTAMVISGLWILHHNRPNPSRPST